MCGLVPLRIHHVPITHVEGFALFPAFIFLVGLQKKADCPISVSAQIHHLFFYEIEEHVRPIINIIHLIQRQWCAQLGNIILAPYQSSVQVGHTKGGHTKKGPQVLHCVLGGWRFGTKEDGYCPLMTRRDDGAPTAGRRGTQKQGLFCHCHQQGAGFATKGDSQICCSLAGRRVSSRPLPLLSSRRFGRLIN